MIEYLDPRRGGMFVDVTLGLGGHAEALLEAAPNASVLGIDRDPEARAIAAQRLKRFAERVSIAAGNFADLSEILAARKQGRVAGILADL
ncbi:MAG TPA: 16S rRNA (cytosine(1402)-N(4))-methyltransferase, partial [Thermoanaerobaculia bacterium]|nr:16S rRNA (cytosine(1402)-N(4))-methyltransferase [Thermoanaerobaculia bacterium]